MGRQKVLTSDLQIQGSMSKIVWIFLLSFLVFENISFCYSYISDKRDYTLINCQENFHPTTCLSIFLYISVSVSYCTLLIYLRLPFYRVSHIEMSESKWSWGVEGSIILLIFLWRHVQQHCTFEFHQSIFT